MHVAKRWGRYVLGALLIVSVGTSVAAAQGAGPGGAPGQRPGRSDPAFSQPSVAPGVDYTVPSEAEIKAVLDRIREHFVRSTPYRIIDTATGQPLDRSVEADQDGGHRQARRRVQRLDLLDGRRAGGDAARHRRHRRPDVPGLRDQELRLHLRSPAVLPPAGEGIRSAARRLPAPASRCASSTTAAPSARRSSRLNTRRSRIPATGKGSTLAADYIPTKQMRLPDGTLARPRPVAVSLWVDDVYMSIPFLAQMGKTDRRRGSTSTTPRGR